MDDFEMQHLKRDFEKPDDSEMLHDSLSNEIKLGATRDAEVSLEVIVADLHDRVIHSCDSCFQELGLPVTLLQQPIQNAILDSMKGVTDVVETWVIFGGYGNGQINSGLQKQFNEVFPEQLSDLRLQALACGGSEEDEQDINMANQGRVWMARPALASHSGPIRFISCAAYPRCQSPSEQEHVRRMFHRALDVVARNSVYIRHLHSHSQHTSPGFMEFASSSKIARRASKQKIRIITHALGSFVGHTDPGIFGWGLANGLNDMLAEF